MAKIVITNVKFGADPEIIGASLKNKYAKSFVGLLGGSKTEPKPLAREGCALQEDNVLAEYNIKATNSVEEWIDQHLYVIGEIEAIAKANKMKLDRGTASRFFSPAQLDNEQARTFGCDPDYNAYTGEENVRPKPLVNEKGAELRTAGGHIHFGFDTDSDDNRALLRGAIIRAADIFLGVPSIFIDPDEQRRTMYGKAGAFRPKSYGVEYRTLSTFWTATPERLKWAFEQAQKVMEFVSDTDNIDMINDENVIDAVQQAINENDKVMGEAVMNRFGIELPQGL